MKEGKDDDFPLSQVTPTVSVETWVSIKPLTIQVATPPKVPQNPKVWIELVHNIVPGGGGYRKYLANLWNMILRYVAIAWIWCAHWSSQSWQSWKIGISGRWLDCEAPLCGGVRVWLKELSGIDYSLTAVWQCRFLPHPRMQPQGTMSEVRGRHQKITNLVNLDLRLLRLERMQSS